MTKHETHNDTISRNHLRDEKSPYLIQHSAQPVDWYAWGEEAFERARAENKPVLVSVGYSTCHWCHVMAAESFEDPRIAEQMNRAFVCVKVDREERPDIDAFLISAVSALTGSAGWPLNVFLTPQGKPFFGGTYFPPRPRHQMPGWPDVLARIEELWQDSGQREKIEASASSIVEHLQKHLSHASAPEEDADVSLEVVRDALEAFAADFDAGNGGFSPAPKFPMPPVLDFLLTWQRFAAENRDEQMHGQDALRMLTRTLDAMAAGGIYDHIGGGFHRYATDSSWHVPHFEKMLYDNAQLIPVYTAAWELTGKTTYAEVARETIDYVLRDMTHPDGGFYSAEDADSVPEKADEDPENAGRRREGAFYVWTSGRIEAVLSGHPDPLAKELFCYVYDVRGEGNAAHDPFGEFRGQNILHRLRSPEAAAVRFDLPEEKVREILGEAEQMLFAARRQRPRPHLDDKVLTAWNGLMISALARAYPVFHDTTYLAAARRAADFIYSRLYDPETGRLFRRWREEEAKFDGLSEDYAFLVQGLLDLYAADFSPFYLQWADELMRRFLELFTDSATGAVYLTPRAHDPLLVLAMKDGTDNVTPSAASVAACSLVRLARITGNPDFEAAYQNLFRSGAAQAARVPKSVPALLKAVLLSRSVHVHMVIAGSEGSADAERMTETGRRLGGLGQSIVWIKNAEERKRLARVIANAEDTALPDGGAAAYACFHQSCRPPVDSAEKLADQLESAFV
ncbi:MAG: thioredoxin domain-containing protein [Desulfosalsimonadaceae bacterium]